MTRVLDGLRVVDFGQYLSGPLVSMMLSDQGADVIRVDPPGGPRWQHPANVVLQRGKRSIVLDLKQQADLETAKRLVSHADVVIENFRPGVMQRLGLGPETMTESNPRLIYCSLPGFAADDPRAGIPAWEGIVEAATGVYSPRIAGAREAIFNAVTMASNFGAFVAANSVMAALIARERCGRGQRVEVPLYNAMFEAIGGQGQKPNPTADTSPALPLGGMPYQCSDGRYVLLFPSILTPYHFEAFAAKFLPKEWDVDGLLDAQRLIAEPELGAELRKRLAVLFKERTALEWEQAINAIGVPAAICKTSQEWLQDEHARAVRSAIPLDDYKYGPTWQAGFPVGLSATPPEVSFPRRPLDADRHEILDELDRLAAAPKPALGSTKPLGMPLEGYRVIDTTQILAGPTAAKVLAEFGAEVIKINNPEGGPVRGHLYVNSGKKSILLDIASEEGQEVLWKLVQGSQVFMQNFRLGVAERIGIGEAPLRAHRPDIVYSSVSTYGYGGPRSADRGWESLGQAPTGMFVRHGGDGQPAGHRYQVCDYGTGMLSAFAILLGLYHQLRTGEGQHVQAALSYTGTYHQIPFMADYAGRSWDEPKGLDAKGWGPLDRLYRGSDRWFYLAAPRPQDIEALATVSGIDGIDFTAAGLEQRLEERFATATAEEWVERITATGVAAHLMLKIEEVMEDPWTKEHGLSVLRDHPGVGVVRSPGLAPRLSLTPGATTKGASLPGWDLRDVLEKAGLVDGMEKLLAGGAAVEELPGGIAAVV